MSSNQDFNMFTNSKHFWQMFILFLQNQASVPASQAPSIKSERTLDSEVFTREGSSIEQINKGHKIFRISLSLKITLNLDRIPTPEACIAYTFSRISETTQCYIALKIQDKYN